MSTIHLWFHFDCVIHCVLHKMNFRLVYSQHVFVAFSCFIFISLIVVEAVKLCIHDTHTLIRFLPRHSAVLSFSTVCPLERILLKFHVRTDEFTMPYAKWCKQTMRNWKQNPCETITNRHEKYDRNEYDTTNDIVVNLSRNKITFRPCSVGISEHTKQHSLNMNNTTIYPAATCIKHWYTCDCLHSFALVLQYQFVLRSLCLVIVLYVLIRFGVRVSVYVCSMLIMAFYYFVDVFRSYRSPAYHILYLPLWNVFFSPFSFVVSSCILLCKNSSVSFWLNEAHVSLSSG